MEANADPRRCFAFIFPMASGHINPSLPVARGLVKLGQEVHYLCREQMREAIKDTGASFHSDVEHEPEMYDGRMPSLLGAIEEIKRERGMENEPFISSFFKLRNIMLEMMLPGAIRWLQKIGADCVVQCPIMNAEAAHAAKVLDIPSIALLTTAGPGSWPKAMQEFLGQQGLSRNEVGTDGKPRGLTGRELCRAAWGGSFDALGSSDPTAPLLLVALGPQPNALGELEPAANALCLPVMPQVDVLKEGVDLFLTHGGQNSLMEALSTGTPVVVCPGFADQPVNARKAVDLGVGLQVERPVPGPGEEAAATGAYRAEVAAALSEVLSVPDYRDSALGVSQRMRAAGGVPRAVELVLGAPVSKAGIRPAGGCSKLAGTIGDTRAVAHRAGA